jgi:MFS family permease
MIPFEKRGMYQAAQNILIGFGAVSGASLGGLIADWIGWRYCFLLQVPIALMALIVGYVALQNPQSDELLLGERLSFSKRMTRVDVLGSVLLVFALLVQLLGLSLGGNELPWNHIGIVGLLVASVVLLGIFVIVETNTPLIPVVDMRMLRGKLPVSLQITNIFSGMAGYAVSVSYMPAFHHTDFSSSCSCCHCSSRWY